ncbi:MAG: ParM/StbA family protein [Rhodocyclaceae bacterium]|nr:ParM/StbA family protein [Rhodocyclaceae bacterium]
MQETAVIGLDVGHSAVKMTFDTKAGVQRALFPSLACAAIEIRNPLEAERARQETVQVKGRDYFVGETARIQAQAELASGLTEAWIESAEHAALIKMALRIVQRYLGEDSPRLWVVGLPVGQFARDRERLAAIVRELLPPQDRIKVLQQPDAAYFAHIYDRSGMPRPDVHPEEESWAVVDIGYYTTDFVLYEQGRYVESASGRYAGVREIAESVQRALAVRGIERSLIDVERALPRRSLLHRGQSIDLQQLVQEALQQMFAKVLDESARLMGRRLDAVNGILVAGGSAEMLAEHMRKVWPHTVVVRDEHHQETDEGAALYGPRFVISEGYYRYGKSSLVLEQLARARASA